MIEGQIEGNVTTASLANVATYCSQLVYLRSVPMGILYTSADPKPYSKDPIVSTS